MEDDYVERERLEGIRKSARAVRRTIGSMTTAFSKPLVGIGLSFLLLASITLAGASHWSECHFDVTVLVQADEYVTLNLERVLHADGTRGNDPKGCTRAFADGTVALQAVTEGAELLVPGTRLHARWLEYGAMAPSGPIYESTWAFSRR
ncbi:hypothetical protein [Thioalkalivibrio sp. ALE9]|uniref:hypothetical protein n=1 Tax=Thioalkalivibrio sp. ALE9 TaxID=1158169 RepID=UPI00037280F4|nr:hypothetical protein [Thioalkalivibrio sp. ALE9]